MTSGKNETFAAVYNDVSAYPTIADVAYALGKSRKTVKNVAAQLRQLQLDGKDAPVLVWRGTPSPQRADYAAVQSVVVPKPVISPAEHAEKRANGLQDAVATLFQSTDYPVINPEALVVKRQTVKTYERLSGTYVEREGAPRTWLTDTLRVAKLDDVRGRAFIFTSAQNDTEVHQGLWNNLLAYSAHKNAKLAVGPLTYETNWWDENNPASRAYDGRIEQYLCFGQMELGDNFVFCGEMNTLPTANRPISDLTNYTRSRWGVFPHARVQLISVPSTNPGEQAHQLMSTGSVTPPKVVPRKAGIKSIAQHTLGATIVEFDEDGLPFCRQLLADTDGSFYDLDLFVSDGIVTDGHSVRMITTADTHTAKLRGANSRAVYGYDPIAKTLHTGSLIEVLQPDYLLLEDLHDNEARNHHHSKDVSHNYEMAVRERDNVLGEVRKATEFVEAISAVTEAQIVVIESNHDLALERYVREGRYRMDGLNYMFGLQMDVAYHQYRAEAGLCIDADMKPPKFSMLEWAMKYLNDKLEMQFVYVGDSFVVDGVEAGNHGHLGANGAKGTMSGFARLGRPMTIADKHSPGILDEVFCAGAMELQHGYNKGPSGWATAHVIQYRNGKRCLVTMQSGKWRP